MSQDNPAKASHGGSRCGAGRPRGGLTRRINVTLDVETIEYAKRLGNGNLSAGIRKAVKDSEKAREASCGGSGKNQ